MKQPKIPFNKSLLKGYSFFETLLPSNSVVMISMYCSLRTLYVRGWDSHWKEKIVGLNNDLAIEALKEKSLTEPPNVGDLVIARYYQDNSFYRAEVCRHKEDKFLVFFIDYGNFQEAKLEDLKFLKNDLKLVPAFAMKINLKHVPDGSSLSCVNYYNVLTAQRVPLILTYEDTKDEAVLQEKDSKDFVHEIVLKYLKPSWKRNNAVLSKSGDVFYAHSIKKHELTIGETYSLIISCIDEKEFKESQVFWAIDPSTDEFFLANSEMYLNINEYCDFLKDDFYLPRDNELCLAKDSGEWHRCVCVETRKTTCSLFFADHGHSALVKTNNVRKMIKDFTEVPLQALRCTFPDDGNLKTDETVQSKVIKYLKKSVGEMIHSIKVWDRMGDTYILSIPEVNSIIM